jgi:hypothetical protein
MRTICTVVIVFLMFPLLVFAVGQEANQFDAQKSPESRHHIDVWRIDLNDPNAPLPLPPFPNTELRNQLTGSFTLKIRFNNGKPSSITMTDAHISYNPAKSPEVLDAYLAYWRRVFSNTISQWKTIALNEFEADIVIEYKLDASLTPEARTYNVEYQKWGVPSRITVIGPMLKPTR